MIQVKIRAFLELHSLSVYELAQAVVEETEALSEASIYKITSGQRNPSLASLDLIIGALRRLTSAEVQIGDVVSYVSESTEMSSEESHDELTEVWELVKTQLPLSPLPPGSSPALERRVNRAPPIGKPIRQIVLALTLAGTLFTLSPAPVPEVPLNPPEEAPTTMGLGSPPPQLLATAPGSLTPLLQVSPESDAHAYDFQLVNSQSGQALISIVVPEPSYKVPETYLCPAITYTWTARAQRADGWSSYAVPVRFRVDTGRPASGNVAVPPAPALLFPSGTVNSLTPTLRVSEVPGARHYGFYVRDLDSGALVYVDEFSPMPERQLPEGVLRPGTNYRWNAQARNCAGFSAYSARFDFQTASQD